MIQNSQPSAERQRTPANLLAIMLLATTILQRPASAAPYNAPVSQALAAGFADPPSSARPRVWWHWMNGNVTKDGITKDLQWMKRVGIGGLQNFDANLQTPQIVDRRLVYMTPEWKDAFRHAASTADQLGLEMAIAASPGWSETGGPWVPPRDGMKKLVWSETIVEGGRRFQGALAPPPRITGPFQNLPMAPTIEEQIGLGQGHKPVAKPSYYADALVLALPVQKTRLPRPSRVTDQDGRSLSEAALTDSDLVTAAEIAVGTAQRPASVGLVYETPTQVRSATIFVPGAKPFFGDTLYLPVLEARDGAGWRKIAELPLALVPTTISFAPVVAREFRVVFGPNTAPPRVGLGEEAPGAEAPSFFAARPAASLKVADLRLLAEPKVDRFEAKAGFVTVQDYHALSNGTGPEVTAVPPGRVLDLTKLLRADGRLDWTPPAGRWQVLRLGYSLLGTTNHPAPAEATGLEVDKYDGAAVRRYLDTYLGMYRSAAGNNLLGKRGVGALLTDSIEAGDSNWTGNMIAKFKRLRGYDPTPWLPTLTGTLVGSRAQSDAFLYDYRRTLGDLLADEHYGTVAQVAHAAGLKVYGEALEDVRPLLGDDMAMRKYSDVPMAALWTYDRSSSPRPTLLGDMKGAASVAHIYGQNIVAAESMTSANSPWAFAPADLRRFIDLEFAYGINRPVIHTSVHQPVDDKVPGLSLMIFGQYFNRHDSWAEMARPWIDYIARSSYLLQQGRDFSDVAYFFGEEAPLTALHAQAPLADTPKRYAYDFVNSDVLLNELSVDNGELVARRGARYRVLYLGGSSRKMTLPVLRRLAALVEQGATIVGRAPQGSPSLKDDRAAYDGLVRTLWSSEPTTRLGKGRVVASSDVEAALRSIGVKPDFDYTGSHLGSEILFVHRRLADGDIYFVNNRNNRAEVIEAKFRVAGRQPEIWRADTGKAEPVSYRFESDVTIVPLEMTAEDSFFLLFRNKATAASGKIDKPALASMAALGGSWDVSFQPGRGAPPAVKLAKLGSLSEQPQPGVKYFSGTSTYRKEFTLPRSARTGGKLLLDLGRVGDVAEVRVNGQLAGTVWHAPYRLDIGKLIRSGVNQLEIRVANVWVNRLIGDKQLGANKVTFTAAPTYKASAPLRPSGLIGPVTLLGRGH